MSTEDIIQCTWLLDSEINIMKSELLWVTHKLQAMKDKIKENSEKIKGNKTMLYFVSNIFELLDVDPNVKRVVPILTWTPRERVQWSKPLHDRDILCWWLGWWMLKNWSPETWWVQTKIPSWCWRLYPQSTTHRCRPWRWMRAPQNNTVTLGAWTNRLRSWCRPLSCQWTTRISLRTWGSNFQRGCWCTGPWVQGRPCWPRSVMHGPKPPSWSWLAPS